MFQMLFHVSKKSRKTYSSEEYRSHENGIVMKLSEVDTRFIK